jgi:beta-lactamase class A
MTSERLATLAKEAGLLDPSVLVRPLERPGEPSWTVAPDRPLSPASMIKVPLAAALATLWEVGTLRPGAPARVGPAHLTANDASSPFEHGVVAGLADYAALMVTRSDNVATNVLIDAIGRDRANTILAGFGLRATAIRRKLSGCLPLIDDPEATGRNAHPAADAARLFEAIATDRIPGSNFLRELLRAQEWNDKLSLGLRPGDRFAHKTGDHDAASHDGGILDTREGRRYVVVVYTRLASSPASDARLGDFMRMLRPFL